MSAGRRAFFILLLLTAVFAVFICASAVPQQGSIRSEELREWANRTEVRIEPDRESEAVYRAFVLPSSLRVIEDEAFSGTAAVVVELPEGTAELGERAFADMRALRLVRIPDSARRIAASAFSGSAGAVIHAAPGSYAARFAARYGLAPAPEALFCADGERLNPSAEEQGADNSVSIPEEASADGPGQGPRHGNAAEETADRYEQCIADHVQGRAPPFIG